MHPTRALTLLGLSFALGCVRSPEPEPLGTFSVTSIMRSNTCGPQVAEVLSLATYEVDLALRSDTLTWSPRGASQARGAYNSGTGAFRLVHEQTVTVVQPDPRREVAGCMLVRADVIEGVVDWSSADGGVVDDVPTFGQDASTAPRARGFRGTETVVWGPTPGSDCRGLLGAQQGQFIALPCELTYSLTAAAR